MTKMLDLVDDRAAGIVAATPDIAERYHNPRTMLVGNGVAAGGLRGVCADFDSSGCCSPASRIPAIASRVVDAVAALTRPDPDAGRAATDDPAWQEAQAELGDRLEYFGWLDRAALCQTMSQSAVGVVADDRPTTRRTRPTRSSSSPQPAYRSSPRRMPRSGPWWSRAVSVSWRQATALATWRRHCGGAVRPRALAADVGCGP